MGLRLHRLRILREELGHVVPDVACKVAHDEGALLAHAVAAEHEELARRVLLVHLEAEGRRRRVDAAARVERLEDAGGRQLEHLEAARIVAVLDSGHRDALEGDNLLLRLEHGVDEELVQLLVGKVDAQLLERVGRNVLEAEDVEQVHEDRPGRPAARRAPSRGVEHLVDPLDHPREEQAIERLAQAAEGRLGLLGAEVDAQLLVAHEHVPHRDERLDVRLEQHLARVPHRRGSLALPRAREAALAVLELDVAHVQQRR